MLDWRQQKMMFDAQDFAEVRSGAQYVVDALDQLRADVGAVEAAPRICGSKRNEREEEQIRASVCSDLGMNNAVAL